MKRALLFSLAAIVILTAVTGCSSGGKPDTLSEDIYELGLQALEIADDYLNFKLTADEATQKLDDIQKRLDSAQKDSNLTASTDAALKLSVSTLNLSIFSISNGLESLSDADVLKNRDSLANLLGKKRIGKNENKSEATVSDEVLPNGVRITHFRTFDMYSILNQIPFSDDYKNGKLTIENVRTAFLNVNHGYHGYFCITIDINEMPENDANYLVEEDIETVGNIFPEEDSNASTLLHLGNFKQDGKLYCFFITEKSVQDIPYGCDIMFDIYVYTGAETEVRKDYNIFFQITEDTCSNNLEAWSSTEQDLLGTALDRASNHVD